MLLISPSLFLPFLIFYFLYNSFNSVSFIPLRVNFSNTGNAKFLLTIILSTPQIKFKRNLRRFSTAKSARLLLAKRKYSIRSFNSIAFTNFQLFSKKRAQLDSWDSSLFFSSFSLKEHLQNLLEFEELP